jgi:hypothetical protein
VADSDVQRHLDAHAKAIDDLHQKLAAVPGTNTAKLQVAVDKLKVSFVQFTEDASGCMI